jgi:DNA-binding NtrC family response regulator
MTLIQKVMELEISEIKGAIEATKNNKSQAARLLGLNRTCLVTKMKKYGFPLNPPIGGRKKKKETK